MSPRRNVKLESTRAEMPASLGVCEYVAPHKIWSRTSLSAFHYLWGYGAQRYIVTLGLRDNGGFLYLLLTGLVLVLTTWARASVAYAPNGNRTT